MAKAEEQKLDPATHIVAKGITPTGDLYLDSMALAKQSYESLGADTPWEELSSFAVEGLRSQAQQSYFFGNADTLFQQAASEAQGREVKQPKLSSLQPKNADAGLEAVEVKLKGSNFTGDSKVYFAGVQVLSTLVDDSELKINVIPDLEGSFPVFVRTPRLMDTDPEEFTIKAASQKKAKQLPAEKPAEPEAPPEPAPHTPNTTRRR